MVRHVHIIGTPRSGTTLLLELMRCCYDWDWAPKKEMPGIDAVRRRHGKSLSKWPGGGVALKPFLSDPGSWIIFCKRDPRDVVCSRHAQAPDVYWSNLYLWRRMRKAAAQVERHPRFIAVSYERLVESPGSIQQELETQIPWLERKARFSEFHYLADPSHQSTEALHGVRPISTASVGLWRNNRERLAGQLSIHGSISKELIEDGYETDDQWLAELAGVVPDLSPGRWPESAPLAMLPVYWIRRQVESAKLRLILHQQKSR